MEHKQLDYEQLRAKWVHEDELINHRLTWLLVSQSILFAGYGVLLTASPSEPRIERLIALLPWCGASTSLLILTSIWAAIFAMRELSASNSHAPIEASPRMTLLGLIAPAGLPVVFIIVWIVGILMA